MQYVITSQGLRLAYLEAHPGRETTIFFIHGNSGSSRIWKPVMEQEALKPFRLLAIDLPGHGLSDRAQNPEELYSPGGTAQLLSEAVSQLAGGKPYLLAGFCYGTNLISEMIAFGIHPKAFVFLTPNILGGTVLPQHVFRPNKELSTVFEEEVEPEDAAAFFCNQLPPPISTDDFAEDFLKTDRVIRRVLAAAVESKNYSDEIELVTDSGRPVLCIFGANDSLVNVDYLDDLNLNWKIVKLTSAGHFVHVQRPHEVAALISELIGRTD